MNRGLDRFHRDRRPVGGPGRGPGRLRAHGLKTLVEQNKFSAKDLETFHTAVQYQMIHALGLILIGLLAAARPSGMLDAAGWTMFAGILALFRLSLRLRGNRHEALRHVRADRRRGVHPRLAGRGGCRDAKIRKPPAFRVMISRKGEKRKTLSGLDLSGSGSEKQSALVSLLCSFRHCSRYSVTRPLPIRPRILVGLASFGPPDITAGSDSSHY